MFVGLVGEGGLLVRVVVSTVGLGVKTLMGATAVAFGRTGSTDGLITPMVVVETVGTEPWMTGWSPTAGVARNSGTLAVEANDRTGVPGNATLNRGSGSLAGGERLSGEALGGVRGA